MNMGIGGRVLYHHAHQLPALSIQGLVRLHTASLTTPSSSSSTSREATDLSGHAWVGWLVVG